MKFLSFMATIFVQLLQKRNQRKGDKIWKQQD